VENIKIFECSLLQDYGQTDFKWFVFLDPWIHMW
jgi:hypothetical protein